MSQRPAAPRALKKQQKPLVCFVRLYGAEQMRMRAVCKHSGGKPNAIALAGIMAEIQRLEARSPGVSTAEAAALAHCRALGVDPLSALAAAAERALGVEHPIFPATRSDVRPPTSDTPISPGAVTDPRPAA